nr:hypothetical protein [Enterobacter hormaechei]
MSELVKRGHDQVAELKSSCGAVDVRDVAQLISDLATQLDVQLGRSNALAAENAGLKAGFKYFSYSEMAGFEEHGTAELAMKSADADLAGERDEASSEGWSEETDTICWGVIVQKAVENKFEKPSEENGWIGWSDYALLPSIETPATDAFLAEARAQGVEMLRDSIAELGGSIEDTIDLHHYCSDFAAQLRKGVPS